MLGHAWLQAVTARAEAAGLHLGPSGAGARRLQAVGLTWGGRMRGQAASRWGNRKRCPRRYLAKIGPELQRHSYRFWLLALMACLVLAMRRQPSILCIICAKWNFDAS